MRVFVFNMRGRPLMPCSQRKARLLLRENKAKIYKYHPFTIQLTYTTGETKQDCHIGIDTGSKYIGAAVRSEDKVFGKAKSSFDRISGQILIRNVFIAEADEIVKQDTENQGF